MTDKATHTPLPYLIEVERDEEGRVLICTGCGTVETVRSIKSRSATAFTCCPERKMVPAWNTRAVNSHHDLIEALREAREALCNHACHGGKEAPCIRSDDQCRAECGYLAGDAIVRIDAILTKAEAGHD